MPPRTLLEPTRLGPFDLPNRIVMAPMTRSRADEAGVSRPSTALYYAQRASAGLIVSEAINISPDAVGSPLTPGLHADAQIAAWRAVTRAVHEAGGRIAAQLWHTGRVGHSVVRGGVRPVTPSAVAIAGQQHFTGQGMMAYETPRALEAHEVEGIARDYGRAAANAIEAGFDAVELHAAFGYLPNQFLVDGANRRTDRYGGSIPNRVRFTVEVMEAIIGAVGADRAGIKISPVIPFNGMIDADPLALYTHLIERLNGLSPLYVHLMQALFPLDGLPHWPRDALATFGLMIEAPVIANGGFTAETAESAVASGAARLVSFGSAFVANPDLPTRLAKGLPLAEADRDTMYGGGDEGYVDYPPYEQAA